MEQNHAVPWMQNLRARKGDRMNKQQQGMNMGFMQEIIPGCHHVCLIYDNEEQRREVVSAYLAAGLKDGEIVRYFADTTAPEEIYAWLLEKGVELREDDSFRIVKAENSYCPSGSFVPEDVLANMRSRFAMAGQAGYSASRACGEMTWALRDIPGSNRLLEYENGLNMVQDAFPYVGMCQYDARLFDGATLFNVLQLHPYMIAHGRIVSNPFYIKPEEFLTKLQRNA
jgi:hypothetical protein